VGLSSPIAAQCCIHFSGILFVLTVATWLLFVVNVIAATFTVALHAPRRPAKTVVGEALPSTEKLLPDVQITAVTCANIEGDSDSLRKLAQNSNSKIPRVTILLLALKKLQALLKAKFYQLALA